MIKVIVLTKIKFFDRKLLKYFGIGNSTKQRINVLFGLSSSGFIDLLDASFVLTIEMFIREFFFIEDALKSIIFTNISSMQKLKIYKGLRHKWNLPVNGQRTRTNAQTFRKISKIKLNKYLQDIYKLKY